MLCAAIKESGFDITEVISGHASGVDSLGERWSLEFLRKRATIFEPDWDNLNAPDALIKVNKFKKKYNARAGFARNQEMADYASPDGGLIAIDTGSPGTGDMIKRATKAGLKIFRYNPEDYMDDSEFVYIF